MYVLINYYTFKFVLLSSIFLRFYIKNIMKIIYILINICISYIYRNPNIFGKKLSKITTVACLPSLVKNLLQKCN